MIARGVIDSLRLLACDLAIEWAARIRQTPQLARLHGMDEDALTRSATGLFPLLARALDRGIDPEAMADFFVGRGRNCAKAGVSAPEAVRALGLAQKLVIDFIMNDFAPENPARMYEALGFLSRVAEFFLVGGVYLAKGFTAEALVQARLPDKAAAEFLEKCFRDEGLAGGGKDDTKESA